MWGELSSECGATCLLNVGRLIIGPIVFGASCLRGDFIAQWSGVAKTNYIYC